MRARLRRPTGHELIAYALLAALVVVGLYLRFRNNDYGLPYVYNYDEAQHFTNKAVTMISGDLDPGYYQNPSAFTYLVFVALKLVYGVLGSAFELTEGSVRRQFVHDPTPIWELARGIAAVLAMAGVVGTFWARCGTTFPLTSKAVRFAWKMNQCSLGSVLVVLGLP